MKRTKSSVLGLRSAVCGLQSAVFPRRRRAAFTLIEMLVVLALVGLLASLLFPALMRARERARISKAREEVEALQQAWLAYWNTYTNFPAVSEMDAAAVAILGGDGNPYKIAFMDFDNRHFTEGFKDPWDNLYKVELDSDKTTTKWTYTTRAHCVNTARSKY